MNWHRKLVQFSSKTQVQILVFAIPQKIKAKAALPPTIQTPNSHSGSERRPFQCHPSPTEATNGGLQEKPEEIGHTQINLSPVRSSQLQKLSGFSISVGRGCIPMSTFISVFQVLFPHCSALEHIHTLDLSKGQTLQLSVLCVKGWTVGKYILWWL